MAITYDAPGVGYPGYPDFETPMALYWTRWKYPLQQYGNFTAIVFGRTYAQQQAYWTAEALDTEDPYESGFYLYEESTPEYSQTGGMFQWIRWNATIPSAFNTYTFGAVTFPGYYSEWDADAPRICNVYNSVDNIHGDPGTTNSNGDNGICELCR